MALNSPFHNPTRWPVPSQEQHVRTVLPLKPVDIVELTCPYCQYVSPQATSGLKIVQDDIAVAVLTVGRPTPHSDWCPAGSMLLTQLWVHPDYVKQGLGRLLVQRQAALLKAAGTRCWIAYGSATTPSCTHVPARFLAAVGFTEHVDNVQWRLDLNRTVSVVDRLKDAVAELRRWLPGQGRPAPANRS